MYTSVLTATTIFSALSLVTSTPLTPRQSNEPMALGYRVVRDGSQFIAWLPSKTPVENVCNDHVGFPSSQKSYFSSPSEMVILINSKSGCDLQQSFWQCRPPDLRHFIQPWRLQFSLSGLRDQPWDTVDG